MRGPPGEEIRRPSGPNFEHAGPGAADLIASRIPPGLGGSIARSNDNVYCLGPLEGFLDASGVPPGGLWGCLGGFREASLGLLGASWAPWRPRSPQEIPRTPPSPPQDGPKKPQMAAKGFQKESPEIPERPQEAIKTLEK